MRSRLLLSTAVAGLASTLIAQPGRAETADQTAAQLDPVVVLATRSERRADDTPATVSVITDAQIQAMLATDIKDLIRYEPGVSVPTSRPASAWRCRAPAATETPASPSAAWAATGC